MTSQLLALIRRVLALLVIVGMLAGHGDVAIAAVEQPNGEYDVAVVEHLRVKVPAAGRQAWLEAERGSWEPWLAQQPGFLGRELLWDGEREEGTLLIRWASRAQWKQIPEAEIEAVQERFEQLARQATGENQGNPFPLLFEGELQPAA
ncbi:MAG: TIGR03792 family protein [Synechococcaceae bacterium WBB_3_034]|jgi:uncharacterized protein (TIGR03792 family)|nr:TIGR03792 family protein [Synechococcaceae bacterium WBB_3_034]NDG22431.1 TIGR03792 family protein [Synechococcaceae bacterium WBB_10_009]